MGCSGDTTLAAAMEYLGSLPDVKYRTIKLWLDHGADPDEPTRDNLTVIPVAARTRGEQRIIDLLISDSKSAVN